MLSVAFAAGLTVAAPSSHAATAKELLGDAPGPYGTMKGLRFGMSRKEAAKAAPEIFADKRVSFDPVLYGVSFHPRRGLDGLTVHFMVPQGGVAPGLTSAWGKPTRCTARKRPKARGQQRSVRTSDNPRLALVWRNSKTGLVAWLALDGKGRAEALRFAPTGGLDGVWGAGLVGTSAAAAIQRLGGAQPKKRQDVVTLAVPGPALSDGATVVLKVEGGTVMGATITVAADDCTEARPQVERVVRDFAAKHGGAVTVVRQGKLRVSWGR